MTIIPKDGRDESVLILSKNATLSERVGSDFDRLSEATRRPYCELIDQICLAEKQHLAWWLSVTASRNQLHSRVYHDCIVLTLLEEYRRKRRLPKVVKTDNRATKKVLQEWAINKNAPIKIKLEGRIPTRFFAKLTDILAPAKILTRLAWDIIWCRILRPGATLYQGSTYTLVDTFLLPGYERRDRYYPGLFESLNKTDLKHFRVVPQLLGFSASSTIRLYLDARRNLVTNNVFKYRYLGLIDWWSCVRYWRNRDDFTLNEVPFLGVNIKPIIVSELKRGSAFHGACLGLLNYRFPRALSRRQVNVERTIDWWENQPLDKGWNLGFRKYFPNADLIGYNGMHGAYFGIRPLDAEYHAGVLPDRIAVMGSAYVEDRQEFSKLVTWEVVPALRYQWLWEKNILISSSSTERKILVAMNIDYITSWNTLSAVNTVAGLFPEILFHLKSHPALPLNDIVHRLDNIRENCVIVNEDISLQMPVVDTVICSGNTTIAVEAHACGKQVIIYSAPGLRLNEPHVRGNDGIVFNVAYSPAELRLAIEKSGKTSCIFPPSSVETEQFFSRLDPEKIKKWLFPS